MRKSGSKFNCKSLIKGWFIYQPIISYILFSYSSSSKNQFVWQNVKHSFRTSDVNNMWQWLVGYFSKGKKGEGTRQELRPRINNYTLKSLQSYPDVGFYIISQYIGSKRWVAHRERPGEGRRWSTPQNPTRSVAPARVYQAHV